MVRESTYLQLDLGADEAVSLQQTTNCELRCIRGRVWVTEENSAEDIVLLPGQSRRLTHTGRTVVQSLSAEENAQCRLVLAKSPRGLLELLRRRVPDLGKSSLSLVVRGNDMAGGIGAV